MNKIPGSNYKIRFNDCDMFGHLNNARYLDYMINARQDHLKDFYNFDFNQYYKNNIGWVIASHEIVYLKPAYFDEIVTIKSQLIDVNNDTLFVEIAMFDEKGNLLKSILRSKLIPINIKTGKKEAHNSDFLVWAKTLVNEELSLEENIYERVKQIQLEIQN